MYIGFNAANVQPAEPFTPISGGSYPLWVIESAVKTTKSGKGQMAELTYEVLDGPHKGRKIWGSINIAHENQQAEQIGQRQLSALCHATGVIQLQDTEQLHR